MSNHLNLLPLATRRHNLCWLRIRQWSVAWVFVLALCLLGTALQTSRIASQHFLLSRLEASVGPLRATEKDLEQMQQRLATLRGRESMLAMLERIEQPVQLLGIIGRSIGGDHPEVQVFDLTLSPTQVLQLVKESPPGDDKRATATSATRLIDRVQLKIDGLGVDDLAVARFVAGLREAAVFETVALKSSIRAETLPGECRKFSVECVFQ